MFQQIENHVLKGATLKGKNMLPIGSLSSQSIENQQITFAKYTVLMLCVHQNERKKAFGRSPLYQE